MKNVKMIKKILPLVLISLSLIIQFGCSKYIYLGKVKGNRTKGNRITYKKKSFISSEDFIDSIWDYRNKLNMDEAIQILNNSNPSEWSDGKDRIFFDKNGISYKGLIYVEDARYITIEHLKIGTKVLYHYEEGYKRIDYNYTHLIKCFILHAHLYIIIHTPLANGGVLTKGVYLDDKNRIALCGSLLYLYEGTHFKFY